MRGLLALIIVLAVAGGGYYWYSQNTVSTPDTANDIFNDDHDMDAFGHAEHEHDTAAAAGDTPVAPAPASGGTGVNVDVGATVSTGVVKEFVVTNSGMTFAPNTLTVNRGDRVRIVYRNGGGTHDLRIEGYNVGTRVISSGEDSFEFVADRAGTFEFYCSVGNHRANGMVGTFIVQ